MTAKTRSKKKNTDAAAEWIPFAKGDHYRGKNPQCSRPGCVARPTETRYSARTVSGRVKLIRHSFCAEHVAEEKAKE